MRLYYGIFGRRRPRPYAGFWFPLFGGAFGIGRRGGWFKLSDRRLIR